MRKNSEELISLIEYLIENDINLMIDEKLNFILNATNKKLKEVYGINIKYLMERRKGL